MLLLHRSAVKKVRYPRSNPENRRAASSKWRPAKLIIRKGEPCLMLKLFTAPDGIAQVCRSILTPQLEQLKDCLPAPAAALLTAEMLYPEYCRAWAEQFKTPENFGAP